MGSAVPGMAGGCTKACWCRDMRCMGIAGMQACCLQQNKDPPLIGCVESFHQLDDGGLAAAAGAHQRHDLAGAHLGGTGGGQRISARQERGCARTDQEDGLGKAAVTELVSKWGRRRRQADASSRASQAHCEVQAAQYACIGAGGVVEGHFVPAGMARESSRQTSERRQGTTAVSVQAVRRQGTTAVLVQAVSADAVLLQRALTA